MNTDETVNKLKNARRFLYEISELEKKYGVKLLTISKNTPTGDTKDYVNVVTADGEYEIGTDSGDIYPGYYVALQEV